MHRFVITFSCFFDDASGGGGGAAVVPAPAAAPASSAPSGSTSGTPPAAAGGATPPGGTPAAVAAPKKFEFDEDRSTWVDPNKYAELERKAADAAATNDRWRRMLAAGEGFDLEREKPEDPQTARAREALLGLLPPNMRKAMEILSSVDERTLQTIVRGVPVLTAAEQARSDAQGQRAAKSLYDGVAKAYNTTADKLSEFQKSRLGDAFLAWIQSDKPAQARYASGDLAVVDEFVSEWTGGFAAPAMRHAQTPGAAQADRNSRLPSAPRQGGVPAAGRTPPKGQTEDQIHDAAFAAFAASTAASR